MFQAIIMIYINITNFVLISSTEKDNSMIEMHCLKNVVTFFQRQSYCQVFKQKIKTKSSFFRNNLLEKSDNLKLIGLSSGKHFITESMCHGNQHWAYLCRLLKRQKKTLSHWIFNGVNIVTVKREKYSKFIMLVILKKFSMLTILNYKIEFQKSLDG